MNENRFLPTVNELQESKTEKNWDPEIEGEFEELFGENIMDEFKSVLELSKDSNIENGEDLHCILDEVERVFEMMQGVYIARMEKKTS